MSRKPSDYLRIERPAALPGAQQPGTTHHVEYYSAGPKPVREGVAISWSRVAALATLATATVISTLLIVT